MKQIDSAAAFKYLKQVSEGINPNQNSRLFNFVAHIYEPPTEKQWEVIKKMIEDEYRMQSVSTRDSSDAAKTLLEYSQSKKKAEEAGKDIDPKDICRAPADRKSTRLNSSH